MDALFLAGTLTTAPASARRTYHKVEGQVIEVAQPVRTRNGGEYGRPTIRTRQGEALRLRPGGGGACDGCFQGGDRTPRRIRIGEGPDADYQVRFTKPRRGEADVGPGKGRPVATGRVDPTPARRMPALEGGDGALALLELSSR